MNKITPTFDSPQVIAPPPFYLSKTLLTIGIAMRVNTLWILIMLVPVLLVIQFGIIAREEMYLTKKFGEKYLQYKLTVRRWL